MQYINVKDLKINPANPRIVKDEGFKKLKESLQGAKGKEMFEARPCIVSNRTGDNIIIAGNTRYKAAKELKWQEVPTVIMEGLTEQQEQEIVIRDNVTNGEWDFEILANEWDAVKLEEWGIVFDGTDVNPNELGTDFSLPDGGKPPFQQMTFTLANEQAEIVKAAIDKAKQSDAYKYVETFGNENGNGNALYSILSQYE